MIKRPKLHFNWRLILVQSFANALSLGLTVLLLPGVRLLGERPIVELLASGFIFGILNAFVRPILQFLTFRFLFVTFGLVLIVINFILLWLLGWITPGWFQSDGFMWLLLAAVLVGLIGLFIEVIFGIRPPVLDPNAGSIEPTIASVLTTTLTEVAAGTHDRAAADTRSTALENNAAAPSSTEGDS